MHVQDLAADEARQRRVAEAVNRRRAWRRGARKVDVRVGVRERARLAALAGALEPEGAHAAANVGHAHAEPPAQRGDRCRALVAQLALREHESDPDSDE